jgi:tetratricopeptide (TPR) repeat protein
MLNTMARSLVLGLFAALAFSVLSYGQKPAHVKARTITVSTEPGAKVWIDGVLYGKTTDDGTLTIKTVSSGPHSIRVRADGFKQKEQPVTAVQKGSIKLPLVKTTDEAELKFQEAVRLTSSDRDKAAAAFEEAIKLRPNYPEAYLELARVNADRGDLEGAKKAIDAARKLRPNYAEATAVLGRIYKDSGEDDAKAIAAFKRAITEGKGFQPEANAGLGLLYKEKAEGFGGSGDFENERLNYQESAKYLKAAVKQLSGAPDAAVIYQLLGLAYERQKKLPEAIATYEEFLRLFPDNNEASAVKSFIVQLKKDLEAQP